jgi:U3 small nucleolar RNA-associated protein 6
LHPNSIPLYVLAAAHELELHSPSAARAILQRGLRLNPESVELWTEYVKMELGYVEGLRRRWDVLGVEVGSKAPSSSKSRLETEDMTPLEAEDEDESKVAMKEVMQGVIVKTVMQNAVKCKIERFVC